jgi:hypothetical protein
MSAAEFSPPYLSPNAIDTALRERGVGLLSGEDTAAWIGVPLAELRALEPHWNRLVADGYLKDGGRYRQRRHSCFVVQGDRVEQVPHRAHWQPLEYNALHGGMQRWFEPMAPAMVAAPAWTQLLQRLAAAADALRGPQPWYVEAHPFRIDTTDGIGRPTPEGAHRDGVDLVAVFLRGQRPGRATLHAARPVVAAAARRPARDSRKHPDPARAARGPWLARHAGGHAARRWLPGGLSPTPRPSGASGPPTARSRVFPPVRCRG